METQALEIDRKQAREIFRTYRLHQHYSKPIDREIQRIYQLISQGKVVIRALDAIIQAGLGEDQLPKLAIIRADAQFCWLSGRKDGTVFFSMSRFPRWSARRTYLELPAGSMPGMRESGLWGRMRAMTPLVPLHQRPKRALENHHILFEAEWAEAPDPPGDPMLLRRIGLGDHWLVLAAWELTPIERDVLAGHVRVAERRQQ